jgi:predicted nucleotidyltransferase
VGDDTFSPEDEAQLREMGRNFARRARKAAAEQDQLIASRRAKAFIQIDTLVEQFKTTDPDIRAIILFGSLASTGPTNPHFDIDLAVDSEKYWELLGIALDQPIPVDLADLPRTQEHIRSRICAEGKVLYER